MKKAGVLVCLLALVLFPALADAQCAMCGAIAETDAQGGGSVAAGLNEGILYLMAFPYLLMAGVAYAIYRHKKQRA
jgi:hypothetical protein